MVPALPGPRQNGEGGVCRAHTSRSRVLSQAHSCTQRLTPNPSNLPEPGWEMTEPHTPPLPPGGPMLSPGLWIQRGLLGGQRGPRKPFPSSQRLRPL